MSKNKKHPIVHRNMFGSACMMNDAPEYEFRIYCRKKHAVCVPECKGCGYFAHDEMGYGVACVWEETYEDMPKDEHIVNHDEAMFEHMRVENPEVYKGLIKAIEDGELDIVKAWYGLD